MITSAGPRPRSRLIRGQNRGCGTAGRAEGSGNIENIRGIRGTGGARDTEDARAAGNTSWTVARIKVGDENLERQQHRSQQQERQQQRGGNSERNFLEACPATASGFGLIEL